MACSLGSRFSQRCSTAAEPKPLSWAAAERGAQKARAEIRLIR